MPYRTPPLQVQLEPIPNAEAQARWERALQILTRLAQRMDANLTEESDYETPDIRNAPPPRGAPVSE
jgi:hypothetical protein